MPHAVDAVIFSFCITRLYHKMASDYQPHRILQQSSTIYWIDLNSLEPKVL